MAMNLRDIEHASNALGLLEQARQELLKISNGAIADKADKVEFLYAEIGELTERASGLTWE